MAADTGDACLLVEKTESPPLSASDRRVNSDAFIGIDDHEFMSVSSLVRGRVKLSEVNQVRFQKYTIHRRLHYIFASTLLT